MIKLTTSTTVVALAATALLVAGCGGGEAGDVATSSPGAPTSTGVPQMSNEQAPPKRLVVAVTIKGGQVTPTNAQLKSSAGEPIVFRIDSDAADQLHVHSNPEHTFTVDPRSGQSFQFTVAVPGKVDVGLSKLNRTIATIEVQ